MIDPTAILLLKPQLSQVSAWARGALRSESEQVGLGVSVPKTRKMDYIYRDMCMPIVVTYISELVYKSAEHAYVTPNCMRFLDLDELKQMYKPDSIHLPKFAKTMKIENMKGMPKFLTDRMYGSHVGMDEKSFYLIPDLLENQTIPELEKKLKLVGQKPDTLWGHFKELKYMFVKRPTPQEEAQVIRKQIQEVRFMAHHVRRTFNPYQYVKKYLLAEGHINKEESKLLLDMLNQSNWVATQFLKTRELLNKLDKAKPSFATRVFRAMRGSFITPKVKPEDYKPVQKLVDIIHDLAKNPAFNAEKSDFFGPLVSLSDKKLLEQIKGSTFFKDIAEEGFRKAYESRRSHTFAHHNVMEAIHSEALIPWFEEAGKKLAPERRHLLENICKDLVENKINLARISKVLKSADLYLKIPMSVLAIFIVYGILANNFEAKFLLPFQRHVVQKKGHSKDFVIPGYLAPIPTMVTYYLVSKIPQVQRLGHIGAFAVSGFASLVAMVASTAFGFLYMYKHTKPEKPPKKPDPVKPPGEFKPLPIMPASIPVAHDLPDLTATPPRPLYPNPTSAFSYQPASRQNFFVQ